MIRCILVIFVILFLFACKDSPYGIIDKIEMKNILWDVLRADALSQEIVRTDSSKSAARESALLTQKVFSIHHVTEKKFQKSYSYYIAHPDILNAMFDSINAQQSRVIADTPKKKIYIDSNTIKTKK